MKSTPPPRPLEVSSSLQELQDSLSTINSMSTQPSDGLWLEQITASVAPLLREWDLSECVAWKDWTEKSQLFPELSHQDIGIDLVGKRDSGRYVAIQCKARRLGSEGGGSQVTKHELDSFVAITQSDYWEERWLVTNGDNPLAPTAQKAQSITPNPVKMIVIGRDIHQELNAREQFEPKPGTNKSKNEMQEEAVSTCVAKLRELVNSTSGGSPVGEARGRLILPCGAGKTRVSLRIVEELTEPGSISAVLCPSIALVAQIRREYLQFSKVKIDALAVCSDQTAGITKKDEGVLPSNDPTRDTSFVSANEVKGRVTTDEDEISDWILRETGVDDRIKVIFGTYQSASKIVDALDKSGASITVLIADEAHRTAGIRKPKSKGALERVRDFTLCHDQSVFPARYRVYQTATPRIYSTEKMRQRSKNDWAVRTMDDETVFGVELYRRSYVDAVKNGWLCDYRIIAIGVNDAAAFDQANKLASMARADSVESLKTAHYLRGLSFALAMSGATRSQEKGLVQIGSCIGFMNTIEKSKNMVSSLSREEVQTFIQDWFKANGLDYEPTTYRFRHLDASANVTKRQQALQELGQSSPSNPFGILNVGIFGEGTDSPALNAVAFLEPRKSPIDVIQAVGRAMRTAPGKEVGYIICPVLIPPNVDPEKWLSTSSMSEGWQELGEILLALRAHDGRIETELQHLLSVYLPADPTLTRNLIGLVNTEKQIEYYEQEGTNNSVYESLEQVILGKSTPRKEGFVKLANRGRKEWNVKEPGLMVTAKQVDDKIEIREDSVQRKKNRDGSLGSVDIQKCKKQMKRMINENSGRPHIPKPQPPEPKPQPEAAGLRFLRLSDAIGNEKAIQLNLLQKSGLKSNRVERDLNLLEDSVEEAARHLDNDELEPTLAKHFGYDQLRKPKPGEKRAKATTVASLIFMNAAMMQQRIDDTGYIDTSHKLVDAKNHPEPVGFLRRCWTNIIAHDYKTVFEPAIELIDIIEDESARLGGLQRALHHIASEAVRIAETYADMGMDHAGPLFNRVMGDQASDGAFFTRPVAGTLLASLALDLIEESTTTQEFCWSSEDTWKAVKIVDLACGSGTLLAACLADMRRRASIAGARKSLLGKLHRVAVEYSLKGFDINPVSLQLAAAQLSIGNAEIRFNSMGLHRLPYGVNKSDSSVRAGSLEFIDQSEIVPKHSELVLEDEIESEDVWRDRGEKLDARIESAVDAVKDANCVIMNPPFSNRAKMGEKFSEAEQKKLRYRIDELEQALVSSDSEMHRVADKNSVGPLFELLAEYCLKERGVLAMIVPAASLCSTSALEKRQVFASRYHIHTIVTSHRPGRFSFSQNSNINESLLVARKCSDTNKPATRFINLDRFPSGEEEAHELCELLRAEEQEHVEGETHRLDRDWGQVSYWSCNAMSKGDWSPGIWRSTDLAAACKRFAGWSDLVPLGTINDVEIHATGQMLRAEFERGQGSSITGVQIIKKTGEDGQQKLLATPDEKWIPKPAQRSTRQKADLAVNKVLAKAGRLLVTASQSTSTARLTAVAGAKYVGNGWMPVTGLTLDEAKALAVYLNSTVGRTLILRSRGLKLLFPKYSVAEVSNVAVPNVRSNWLVRSVLAQCFDDTCELIVPQFRDGECEVRRLWDTAVEKALKLSPGYLSHYRHQLNREPFIADVGYSQYKDALDPEGEELVA